MAKQIKTNRIASFSSQICTTKNSCHNLPRFHCINNTMNKNASLRRQLPASLKPSTNPDEGVSADSHWAIWCREVSRQPFQQLLRSRERYQQLKPEHRQLLTLPPAPLLKHKKPEDLGGVTLLLDLEGTLLTCRHLHDSGTDDWTGWEAMQRHSTADVILVLPETLDSFKRHKYAVYKRPGLDAFLRSTAGMGFECVAYSTATMELARSLVAQVDRDGFITAVLARKACTLASVSDCGESGPGTSNSNSGSSLILFKDVAAVGRDPARTVLIDDWPLGCANPENLLPVAPFVEDSDEWRMRQTGEAFDLSATSNATKELPLGQLLTVLQELAGYSGDVRDFLNQSAYVAAYLAVLKVTGQG